MVQRQRVGVVVGVSRGPKMNAPSLNDLRNAVPSRELADEKMNQVRDLLIGDFVRLTDVRLAAVETRMRDMETGFGQRLQVLHQRIEALAADTSIDRRAAFEELSKSVLELSGRIHTLSR
jgi:hypothetical protein